MINLVVLPFCVGGQYNYDTIRIRGYGNEKIIPADTDTRIVNNIIEIRAGLEEIKTKLVLNDLVKSNKYGKVEYYTKNGEGCITGKSLMNTGEVAVQNAYMKAGTVLPAHKHPDSIEYLIVYSGELQIIVYDRVYRVQPGQYIRFLKGDPHKVVALKDTWMIGITIPADSGYPK